MNHAKLFTTYTIFALLGLHAFANPSGGAKPVADGYLGCRQKALEHAKKANLNAEDRVNLLKQCLVRYPNAALYNDCKLQVVEKYKKDPRKAREKLKACQQLRSETEYSEREILPFFRVGERNFFAGADLSYEVNFANIKNLPNFSCQGLDDVLSGFSDPEFVMFGNDIKLFKPFTNLNRTRLLQGLKIQGSATKAKPNKKNKAKTAAVASFADIKKLGRLYLDPNKKNDQLFFPLAHCAFSGNLGTSFEDHKLYFLIDSIGKTVVPYFGATFYRHLLAADAEPIKLETMIALVKKRMGTNYSDYKLNSGNILISQESPTDFDSDGDPKDLCKTPRSLSTVAMIRPNPRTNLHVGAIFVVNIKNLCQFGDQIATSWLGQLKKPKS